MASSALSAWRWGAAAAAALAVLAVVAAHGDRPGAGLDRFEPRGVMREVALDRVTAVEIEGGGRSKRLRRTPAGWVTERGGATADATARVDVGLRFLHGSLPQRVLGPEEVASLRLEDAGLLPPRLRVRVWVAGAPGFTADLGATNPQGFSSYVKVEGREEVYLVSRYVAGAWQEVLDR